MAVGSPCAGEIVARITVVQSAQLVSRATLARIEAALIAGTVASPLTMAVQGQASGGQCVAVHEH